jgi:hypothetical protein
MIKGGRRVKSEYIDYLAEYRKYRLPVRRMISSCLVQYLIEVKELRSVYSLSEEYDAFKKETYTLESNYWYKVLNGMLIRYRKKTKEINDFEGGAHTLLCHPICQILSLPVTHFVPDPIAIFLKRAPVEAPKASSYINNYSLKFRSSVCVKTLDALCQPILESYDALAAHDFGSAQKLQLIIDKHVDGAENQWRYPKTVVRLKRIIDNNLIHIKNANLKHSKALV